MHTDDRRGIREVIGCKEKGGLAFVCRLHQEPAALSLNGKNRQRAQGVDATQALNLSAGVSKFNVCLGRSLSRLAIMSRCSCE